MTNHSLNIKVSSLTVASSLGTTLSLAVLEIREILWLMNFKEIVISALHLICLYFYILED